VVTMSSPRLAPAGSLTTWHWLQAAAQMAEPAYRRCPRPSAGPEPTAPGWTAQPRIATRTPPPTPHSVPAARLFALRTMERWGVTDRRYDVAAVVSELMSNAIRHSLATAEADPGVVTGVATGPDADTGADAGHPYPVGTPWLPIRLGLLHPGPCVLCAVADPSTRAPVARRPGPLEETGRGLQLVESLSDHWGYCPAADGRGKVVWAAFSTSSR
jgi:Histidine kinase-like ATPase domain